MIKHIDANEFSKMFDDYNRSENFSYAGRRALFEYLDEIDGIECDIIAFCCEFSEYENMEEFWQDYDEEDYPDVDAISDETVLIPVSGDSFIIGSM